MSFMGRAAAATATWWQQQLQLPASVAHLKNVLQVKCYKREPRELRRGKPLPKQATSTRTRTRTCSCSLLRMNKCWVHNREP